MLSYELCKQLKEAGFPQECNYGDKFYPGKNSDFLVEGGGYDYDSINHNPRSGVKIPTLEELIEACSPLSSDGFQELETIVDNKWMAIGGKYIREIETEGKTPKEAVAKLWIELNKKTNKE